MVPMNSSEAVRMLVQEILGKGKGDMTHHERLGYNHALEAIDQSGSGGLEHSLESYYDNLHDTLHGASKEEAKQAINGFEHALIKHGISYRPHGL
jgi:hypothetical protein